MLSWSEEVASATFWDTSGVAYSDPDLGVSGWPAFSDDGGHVAFGRYGKWVALFTTSGDRIWEIEARSIQSLAVADGGGRVAVARRAQRDTRVLMLNEAGQLLWDIMLDSYRVHGVSFSPSGDKLAVLEYTESGYAVSVLSAETGSQQSRCALGEPSGAGYRGYSFLAVDENGSAVTAIPTPDDAGIVVRIYTLSSRGTLLATHTVRFGAGTIVSELNWQVWGDMLGVSAGRAYHVVPMK